MVTGHPTRELTYSGTTETNRLLNNVVPSFNFPQPSLTDGTDSLRPATLRGLSPDQVLVLVNSFLPYSSLSPFGFSGRFVYGRVTVDF